MVIFNTWVKILCSQWLPGVWDLWTLNSESPPLRCFVGPSLLQWSLEPSGAACLWGCIGLRSGDRLGHLGSLSTALWCTVPQCYNLWLNVSREYSPIHLRIHFATSVSCHTINKHQWGCSVGSNSCPGHNTALIMLLVLWIMSCPLFHAFLFQSFWYRFVMVSPVQRIWL